MDKKPIENKQIRPKFSNPGGLGCPQTDPAEKIEDKTKEVADESREEKADA